MLAASAPVDRISVEGSLLVNTIHVGLHEAKIHLHRQLPLTDVLARFRGPIRRLR